MAGSTFGTIFKVTTFGESHGIGLGAVLDGCPAGLSISEEVIQQYLDLRKPGQTKYSTPRKEQDKIRILSGVFEGVTTGTALAMLIRNTDQRSRDYGNLSEIFRPGHADYSFFAKYGIRDYRGGGRSSGRETAARVAAGAVAKLLLAQVGVKIKACTRSVGKVYAGKYDWDFVEKNPVRTADPDKAEEMAEVINNARMSLDSVGGTIECVAENVPAGWGEVVFDKLDAVLAHAMLSLGAVKGIEFGDGFAAAEALGSANNDSPVPGGWADNHAGGILGGMSCGNNIVFRIAVKPTPSIAQKQMTVDKSGNAVECEIHGRHDPCLCPRMVPVVEAMTAIVLVDMMLRNKSAKI